MTITNGTIYAKNSGYGYDITSGTVTVAAGAVVSGTCTELVCVSGTLNIYGKIAGNWPVKIMNGATVNTYDGCEVAGELCALKLYASDGKCYVNVYGGYLHFVGGTHGQSYCVFYGSKSKDSSEIMIADGMMLSDNGGGIGGGIFGLTADIVVKSSDGSVGLDDTCTAKFNNVDIVPISKSDKPFTDYCKAGYGPVLGNDGYYTIQKLYDITITPPSNGTLETSVTNAIAAGTTVTVTATPADGYTLDTITTNGQTLAGTTFVMPAEDVTVAATFKQSVQPVVPGAPIETKDAQSATNLANTINGSAEEKAKYLKAPDGSGATPATYNTYFYAVVDGTSVKFELNQLGSETATNKANAASASIAAVLTTSATSATITNPEPGFYYSLKQGTNVTNIPLDALQKNKLGVAGESITFDITKDAEAGKGFYQVLVTPDQVK